MTTDTDNSRQRCPVCARPEGSDAVHPETGDCLHGMAAPMEQFTGGLDRNPEELVKEYGYTLEEAREALGIE